MKPLLKCLLVEIGTRCIASTLLRRFETRIIEGLGLSHV
jgi:hypothetical protein